MRALCVKKIIHSLFSWSYYLKQNPYICGYWGHLYHFFKMEIKDCMNTHDLSAKKPNCPFGLWNKWGNNYKPLSEVQQPNGSESLSKNVFRLVRQLVPV